MINLAISMPGQFYRDAITKVLEKTGNFRVQPLEEHTKKTQGGENLGYLLTARDGPPNMWNTPDVALLGVSVYQGYTLRERQELIQELKTRAPDCRIVLFVDELVSPEQTEGITTLRQARLIDGFLYASGTMEYLIATLESI